jgi:hypothetical protein
LAVETEEDIHKRFGRIWPAHTANLTQFLIDCRKAAGGDLDLFLVLAVIGDRTFAEGKADPGIDYATFQRETMLAEPVDINISSIADYSGIPRETVRRKVNDLLARGWVERKGSGFIVATSKAKTDLEPLTEASIRYLARMMEMLRTS